MNENPEKNWFGEKNVSPEEKTRLVRGVFDSVADKYDLMNDLMSGGIHRLWKNYFVEKINLQEGLEYLDVAGGTGDIAFRIRKMTSPDTKITLLDLDEEMLRVGKRRALDRGFVSGFEWVNGNAEELPFPDESVDIYTISFGLRNVTHIDKALKEACRVLKKGGKFYCLEFSRVENPALAKIYDAYSGIFIPKIGRFVANDEESYQYLVESIRKFPDQEELKNRILKAGFDGCEYENLTFGVVAIHYGVK